MPKNAKNSIKEAYLMKDKILIMGAGTVGTRDADVLLSLGTPVVLCKYDAREDDIKTQELKALLKRHKDALEAGKIEVRAARGSDLEERVGNLNSIVGRCDGSIDDLDFKEVALAIDCTNKMEGRNYDEIYNKHNLDFAINGGGQGKFVSNLHFASVPNSRVQEHLEDYITGNAKIVSCNTHAITTLIGIMKGVLGKGDEFRNHFRDPVMVDFLRRHEDPHKGKKPSEYVEVEHKRYHAEEVEDLHSELTNWFQGREPLDPRQYSAGLEGLLSSKSKWPTEYFHTLLVTFDFKDPISNSLLDDIRLQIHSYPRAILTEDSICHEKTKKAAEWARVKDADIPFPVFMVERYGRHHLRVYGLTPQRGIVAPSTADYALLRTGKASTWEEAFKHVNENAKYRDETFLHVKNSVQYNLANYGVASEYFENGHKTPRLVTETLIKNRTG